VGGIYRRAGVLGGCGVVVMEQVTQDSRCDVGDLFSNAMS
jgi:hypothetical protein